MEAGEHRAFGWPSQPHSQKVRTMSSVRMLTAKCGLCGAYPYQTLLNVQCSLTCYPSQRTYSQMERGSSPLRYESPFFLQSSSPTPSASTTPQSQQPRSQTHRTPPPIRFAGDGLDFRRPMPPSGPLPHIHNNPVIDLTYDDEENDTVDSEGIIEEAPQTNTPMASGIAQPRAPRLPNFGREIIDLSQEGPEPTRRIQQQPQRRTNYAQHSPEVEVLSQRRLPHPQGLPGLLDRIRAIPPLSVTTDHADNDDDLIFVGENRSTPAPSANVVAPVRPTGGPSGIRVRPVRIPPQLERILNGGSQSPHRRHGRASDERANRVLDHALISRFHGLHTHFVGPAMDYGSAAFDLGSDRAGTAGQGPAPPPTYEAPPKAPEGFTRSTEEGDVIVCPNCGDELMTGETETKRQVWVVKTCGHVGL